MVSSNLFVLRVPFVITTVCIYAITLPFASSSPIASIEAGDTVAISELVNELTELKEETNALGREWRI